MQKLRIALLSNITSEIMGYMLKEFIACGISVHSVIFDSKFSMDKTIWNERTNGKLPFIPACQFEDANIPFYFVSDHSSALTAKFMIDSKIDLLINAGTPRILKDEILNAPRIGILNCHPGFLPDFRGCTCVEWAIYLDEKIGNTVHLMTTAIDEGPIIIQETLSFNKSDKYHDVRTKIYIHGFQLMAQGIKKIMDNPAINYKNKAYVKNGRYFKVIDEKKMNEVLNKINYGNYKYQK